MSEAEKDCRLAFTKPSKYRRIEGWDDSEGFLTKEQVDFLIQDEKNMASPENALKDF